MRVHTLGTFVRFH